MVTVESRAMYGYNKQYKGNESRVWDGVAANTKRNEKKDGDN